MWSTKNKERDECRAYFDAHKEDKWFRRRYYPGGSEKRSEKRGRLVGETELVKLGRIDVAGAIENFKKDSSTSLGRGVLRCSLCEKKFSGERFLMKHFESRHADAMEKAKDEAVYLNNYLADADRPCAVLKREGIPSSPSQPPGGRGLVSYRDIHDSGRVVKPSLQPASQSQLVEISSTSPHGRRAQPHRAQERPHRPMRQRAIRPGNQHLIRVPPPTLGVPPPLPPMFPPPSMRVPPPPVGVHPSMIVQHQMARMPRVPDAMRVPQVPPRGVHALPTRGLLCRGTFRGVVKPAVSQSRINATREARGDDGGAPPDCRQRKNKRFRDLDSAPI